MPVAKNARRVRAQSRSTLRSLFSSFSAGEFCRSLCHRPAPARSIELLEERKLFSNGIYALNGFYMVPGGATTTNFTANGNVTLYPKANSANNIETATMSSDGKTLITNDNGIICDFPISTVGKVSFYGGNGAADSLVSNVSITVGCSFTAGSANTTIVGGSGNDTIHGAAGNDSIEAGSGNSQIWGGAGNDSLIAGTGNSTLQGGIGNDSLVGGSGADELIGGPGNNVVVPGSSQNYGDFVAAVYTPPATTSLQPVITASTSTTIVAGNAVHLQAVDTGLAVGTALTTQYDWNFGDTTPGSQYNTLVGFNAAHIYNTPGTYTATLTVIDAAGNTATTSTTITVNPTTTLNSIYVSPSGSDANSGSSPAAPIQSIDRLNQLLASNTQVFFQAGATYDLSSSISVNGYTNVIISSYGQGSQPVLMYNGPRSGNVAMIYTQPGSSNVTIENLTFDSIFNTDTNETGMPTAIAPCGFNIAVVNNTFLNVGSAVDAATQPEGLLVQGNSAPSATGLRAYFVWVQGSDIVILGNSVANSTREHIVRVGDSGATRILLAYNTFDNQSRTSVDPSDIAKSTIALQNGSFAYVYKNDLKDGPLGVGPLSLSSLSGSSFYQSMRFDWAVFDSNTLSAPVLLQPGAEHIMIRNNVSYRDNASAFVVGGYNAAYNRQVVDATFANNTVVDNGVAGNFLITYGAASGLVVVNNLYVAPHLVILANGATPMYITGTDLSSFSLISDNVWPAAVPDRHVPGAQMYVWATWENNAGFLTPAQWNALTPVGSDYFANVTLDSNGAVVGPANIVNLPEAVVGVFADAAGTARTGSNATVGAIV